MRTNLYELKVAADKAELLSETLDAIDQATAAIEIITPNFASLDAVATNIANVNAVATNETNINAVNANKINIDTIVSIQAILQSLYDDKATLDSLFADKATLDSLFADKTTLDTLYADKAKLDSIYADLDSINALVNDNTGLATLIDNQANVDTVADAIVDVQSVANQIIPNLAEILQADENATIATTKASEASDSASTATEQADRAEGFANSIDTTNVNTITEMEALTPTDGDACFVKDLDRGGLFVYDSTEVANDNKGTNFNGWIRQYSGAVNVKWFGAKGDGITDDTDAFRLFKNNIESNKDYVIPSGTYSVAISPSDITAVTNENRDFAFMLIDNKSNITISGDGVIIFNAQATNERAWFIIARDCGHITIDKFKLVGTLDFVYEEVSQNINEYGVMFYNCTGSKLTNSFMRQVVVPVSVTGEPTSPATTANLTVNTIISNNLFKLFMQNSTFGAGAEGLIVESNIFEDMYNGFKISRNPLDDSSTIDISKNIILNGNVFKWNSTFNFGAVDYQPTSAWSLVGIELQAPSNNIVITNNVIDMGNIKANTKPMITETSPIILFNNNLISDENYKPKKVSILNNTIIGYKHATRYGIYGSSLIDELKISNNTIEGGIRITSSIYSYYSSSTVITENTIKTNNTLPAGIFIDDLKTQQLNVSNNSLQGVIGVTLSGYSSFILFADCEATKVAIKNNIMDLGGIYSSASTLLTCNELSIMGNIASEININTNTSKNITVSDNRLRTNGTAVKLVLDATTKASCLVSVINNATYGVTADGVGTILNLNGGKLKVSNNGFTSSASQFILDSTVTIVEGYYFGSGAPTQNAFMGVRYTDYNTGSAGNYIKNSFTTNTGWVKIATI